MGVADAGRVGRPADARPASGDRRQFLRRRFRHAGTQARGQARAGGRLLFLDTSPVYAHVVERMRWLPEQQEQAPPRRAAGARAKAAAHAPGRAVRAGGARLLAARPAQASRHRDPRRGGSAGAHARGRRSRAHRRRGEVVGGAPQLRRDHANGQPDRQPGLGGASRARLALESGRQERQRMPAGGAVVGRADHAWRDDRISRSMAGRLRWCVGCSASKSTRSYAASRSSPGAWFGCCCATGWRRSTRRARPSTGRFSVSTFRRTGQSPVLATQSDRSRPRFTPGGMVELDTGNARYLIRFTQTIERQAGWAWAMFNAVRKLSARPATQVGEIRSESSAEQRTPAGRRRPSHAPPRDHQREYPASRRRQFCGAPVSNLSWRSSWNVAHF